MFNNNSGDNGNFGPNNVFFLHKKRKFNDDSAKIESAEREIAFHIMSAFEVASRNDLGMIRSELVKLYDFIQEDSKKRKVERFSDLINLDNIDKEDLIKTLKMKRKDSDE